MTTQQRFEELKSALEAALEYADSTGDTDSIIQIQRELINLNAANLSKEFRAGYPAEVVR